MEVFNVVWIPGRSLPFRIVAGTVINNLAYRFPEPWIRFRTWLQTSGGQSGATPRARKSRSWGLDWKCSPTACWL